MCDLLGLRTSRVSFSRFDRESKGKAQICPDVAVPREAGYPAPAYLSSFTFNRTPIPHVKIRRTRAPGPRGVPDAVSLTRFLRELTRPFWRGEARVVVFIDF